MYKVIAIVIAISLGACSTGQVRKNVSEAPEAVVTAPIDALNINKREIPENLQQLGSPYELAANITCAEINDEITTLTAFAGPDWDADDHYTKTGRNASELAKAVLPYGGIVRFISGASEHEKKLAAALGYASVRRAVLKTHAASQQCVAK